MSKRRQKNIESTGAALRRALDRREVLLAQLVRNEARIRDLIKRNNRARKALHHIEGITSIAGDLDPFLTAALALPDDLDDEIPDLTR